MIDDELLKTERRRVADALRTVGIEVNSVYDLVNTDESYEPAIPVLIALLPTVRESRVKEGVIRALTVLEARGVAARPLLDEFYKATGHEDALKWVIGNTLSVVAEPEHVDEILQIVQDKSHGQSRQMLVDGLGRFKNRPDVVDVLIDLLEDDEVALHALHALRRLKATKARPAVERLLRREYPVITKGVGRAAYKVDPGPAIRSVAASTLKAFDRLEQKPASKSRRKRSR